MNETIRVRRRVSVIDVIDMCGACAGTDDVLCIFY